MGGFQQEATVFFSAALFQEQNAILENGFGVISSLFNYLEKISLRASSHCLAFLKSKLKSKLFNRTSYQLL